MQRKKRKQSGFCISFDGKTVEIERKVLVAIAEKLSLRYNESIAGNKRLDYGKRVLRGGTI